MQKVIATTEKVEFAVPATLGGGTYFVSISGTDSNGVAFDSGATCSTLQVTAPLLSIDTTNAADWKISNGALNIDFNTVRPRIFGLYPAGTTDNLIDLTNSDSMGPKGFYMDNAGFGTGTPVPGFHNAGSYLDWWVTFPSSSANAYTYTEHFVVTPNDPGVHVYFVANHATSDIAGSIGQVQWVLRGDLNKFPNTYSVNADLSNPGPTAIPLPSGPEAFSTDPGRAVQDATVDLHGFTDIPAGFTRSFYTKYDYSSYEYLHRAHGVYGAQYGAWVVLPSSESLVGGPRANMRDFLDTPYSELEELNLKAKEQRKKRVAADKIQEERLKYLTDEKRIKAVTVLFSDLEGRLHMLDYDKKFLVKSWDNLTFDGSSIRGFTAQRESDLRLGIDWGAFYWAPADIFGPGKVLVFGEVIDKDGSPYSADIRGVLKSFAAGAAREERLHAERGQ